MFHVFVGKSDRFSLACASRRCQSWRPWRRTPKRLHWRASIRWARLGWIKTS